MNNFFNPMYSNRYTNPRYYIPPPHPNIKQNFPKNTTDFSVHTETPKEEKRSSHISEKPLFELYGIKLYSDDLLILLLIFFLYKENINDMLLFIALFSLLF